MKSLAENFTYDGFQFRQLAREGDVVLLEKCKPGHSRPSYEVAIIQPHPAQIIHGREFPERESMPPSESWGLLAWSLADLDTAKTTLHEVVTSRANARFCPTPFLAGAS